jgi:hypothetical protein
MPGHGLLLSSSIKRLGNNCLGYDDNDRTEPTLDPEAHSSQKAIRIALEAIQDAGVPVDKVCITGGQIEVHCQPIDGQQLKEKDSGLDGEASYENLLSGAVA